MVNVQCATLQMKHIMNLVRHVIDLVHDGRRRQGTVLYQTSSPRPKFRVVLKFKIHRWKNGKFKRILTFLFVDKGKLCGAILSFEEVNLVFFPAGLGLFWNATTGQRSFWSRFSGTSRTLLSLKLNLKKRVYVFVNDS